MQFDVDIGGRRRQVSVTRTGATFAVTVEGRTWHVDAAQIDAHTLSLLLDNVWSKETVIALDQGSGRLTVRVGAIPVALTLSRSRPLSRGGSAHPGLQGQHDGPVRMTAPMPGKVLRVLVKPGDVVKRRQGLLVVEAMKMENEVRALRDGIVAEVHATEGQSVDAGALLIVIQ